MEPGIRSAQRDPLPSDTPTEEIVAEVVESELFPCARCGREGVAVEEGAICVECEDEVAAEIAEAQA